VHDVEDGLHAGLITLPALRSPSERAVVGEIALRSYCKPEWQATAAELAVMFEDLMELPFWGFSYDGGLDALAAVKNLTSELVGRFCAAAEAATLGAVRGTAGSDSAAGFGSAVGPDSALASVGAGASVTRASSPATARLVRYAAALVVPRRQLLECALLKAVAAHYVMGRAGAETQQAGERELITELALEIYAGAPATLDPVLRPSWASAESDAGQRRVVVDQIASLTDTSAIAWHRRLCS
jgi:dGTPase